MTTTHIIIVCVIFLLAFTVWSFFATARILFNIHLKRSKKSKWSRECSTDDPIQQAMYDGAIEWRNENIGYKKDLHIVNEGLNLYAEYIDYGYDRAVIVIPGRTEGLYYGFYFAKAYAENGFNVLAIDQRAHGNSDGLYNTIGFNEHRDVLAWGKLLHEEYGIKAIVLHGICIGSSCAMFALTNDKCPDYFIGMTGEGMYPNFYENFKNHMIALKKPVFPCLQLVERLVVKKLNITMKYGPIDVIEKNDKPLLMLHSKEDLFSLPETAVLLYEKCKSEKRMVWFEHGAHSQLRFADTRLYDGAIDTYLKEIIIPNIAKMNV